MTVIDRYVADVVDGRIPAGKYHRLACVRHQSDLARQGAPGFPYRWDQARVDRFIRFVGQLRHYKGEWAGQPIALEPWQQFILGSLFGWVHRDTGLRRFRYTYFEIPRKNGKSTVAATAALYLAFFDGEAGAEVYTVATKREQAKIVFNDAKKMIESSAFKGKIGVRVANLHRTDTASKLEPLGADHDSTDGLNPNGVIVDEWHAMKDRGLIDVMETATGARQQPVIFGITTAGSDLVSPCGDQHTYACSVLDGTVQNDVLLAFIAHADPADDWREEATWQKANPNYGVSVKPEDMRALAEKARNMPAAAATFQQKRLNLWVNTDQPWLSLDGWRKGQTTGRTWEQFAESLAHESCYVGIDLASKLDLMSLVAVFPPTAGRSKWALLRWAWTPDETLRDRAHRDRAPYDVWVQQGHLQTTPGTGIDQSVIRETLRWIRDRYDIERVGFDPWHADKLIAELVSEDGFAETQVLAVPQTYAGMSSGCAAFEAEVLAGHVDANNCPLMAWTVGNAVVQRDGKDNIYPVKKKSRGRIDPVMAACIGFSLAKRFGEQAGRHAEVSAWTI